MSSRTYVVVLAGGDGKRLAPLTRALYGTELPKQFAVLAGDKSLLQTTIDRARQLAPLERILVVISPHHEPLAREQLKPYPGVDLVIQPRSLDTGPGMLLPIARILAKDPTANVVFMPSDHHVADPEPIARALREAIAGLGDRISLVGVQPTGPEVEYGWIMPGDELQGASAFTVDRFHEKPAEPLAEELYQRGGLWNTFISAGPVRWFWKLASRYLPHHATALEGYAAKVGTPDETAALHAAYDACTPANFSRDVLSHASSLAVLPVAGSGWSDWGSPSRVFASLAGTTSHTLLVERIRGAA